MRSSLLLSVLVCAVFLTAAQQQNTDQQNSPQQNQQGTQKHGTNKSQSGAETTPKPASDNKPAPLFQGTIGLKSSRQTKDSATLGFNGVDPNGQVQQSFLASSPSASDKQKAAFVATLTSDRAELMRFLKDGNLNLNAAEKQKNAPAR